MKNRTTGTGGILQKLNYTYDNVGNITAIVDNQWTGSRTFEYDDLNRLTSAGGNFGANQSPTSCTYAYNAIGNIIDKCGSTFSYNDVNHPSAVTNQNGKTYSYDANGNMLTGAGKTFTWDIDNRVTSINTPGIGTTLLHYDYTGTRTEKNAPTGTTIYPFQGWEIDPNGVITKFIRIGIETFAAKKSTGQKFFYHNDHLGGVNVISDTSGVKPQLIEYEPWGKISPSEGPNPGSQPTADLSRRFTGKELDPESGLYYYGGRYYDPELGRFISPDPFVPEQHNPQSFNRYSYTINNPVNYIDPTGYFFGKLFKAIGKFFKTMREGELRDAVD